MAVETRTEMGCDVCNVKDADPHHHVLQADGTLQTRHMDCCRDNGCTDLSCDRILNMSGEKRKTALLKWIKSNAETVHAHVSTHGAEE
jgi:hypothetical protein